MALSNTAVPKYYGMFRDAVVQGLIPINQEIELQMNRIDALIADPMYYYDDKVVEGFIAYCEEELTLTDGSDLHLLDSFKLWAEDIFGWYYFVEQKVPVTMEDGRMQYRRKLTHFPMMYTSKGGVRFEKEAHDNKGKTQTHGGNRRTERAAPQGICGAKENTRKEAA